MWPIVVALLGSLRSALRGRGDPVHIAGTLRARLPSIIIVGATMFLLRASVAEASVVRLEVATREDWLGGRAFGRAGAYELVSGRVFYAADPRDPTNATIMDLAKAPRDASGLVGFSGDFVVLRPKDPGKARGSVLLEIPNRGTALFFRMADGKYLDLRRPDAAPPDPEAALLFARGFTFAWIGWQFDVPSKNGVNLSVPTADVSGLVRDTFYVTPKEGGDTWQIGASGSYPPADPSQPDAILTVRSRLDDPRAAIARSEWAFVRDAKSGAALPVYDIRLTKPFETKQLYEIVYRARGSPVAGLGLAAVRDFVSYLKHGPRDAALRERPATLRRVIGFGYSQSGRFLRDFIYQGFNADEKGRIVFDGLMVSSAGAGRGDFNNRFAIPGDGGNATLSVLRPVDMFPFTDGVELDGATGARDGLLVRAARQRAVPKVFYTYTSSEYWARYGSLVHTTADASRDLDLAPTSRLYFFTGIQHTGSFNPPTRTRNGDNFEYLTNPTSQRPFWRGLLLALDEWIARGAAPPASVHPTLRARTLVERGAVTFPEVPGVNFPTYLPRTWRMKFDERGRSSQLEDVAHPALGAEYKTLVPQVDGDGNELGGIRAPAVAAPLATLTGWNYQLPRLETFDYLAGLYGSYFPFPWTPEERVATHDPRRSVTERYRSRDEYLALVRAAFDGLAAARFVLPEESDAVVEEAGRTWDYLAARH